MSRDADEMHIKTLTYLILRGLRWVAVAASVCATVPVEEASAQSTLPTEYQIKAAFLYKFARYVEWPARTFASPTDTLVISVLGKDPFQDTLDRVAKGKTVRGRPIRIGRARDLNEVESAHILFVSESKRRQLGSILERIGRRPLLTVSDTKSFARDGGIIGFGTRDERISLDINVEAARRAGLRVSSRLLKIANVIDGRQGD